MESSSSTTHRSITNTTTTTTSSSSELFICFPSRNNSMKASSKPSILSPGRARDPPSSLSTSLSRRLRTSGSIKNGQASPMFPTGNKKRGSGFDNPEPSSPKVTCIGQVRVKTKKQGKKMRNFSRRPSGEMSFRKMEHNQIQRQSSVNSNYHQQECSSHRNQRWVHLPLTICETLRGFGSEFSCLFPCKSSCFSGEKDVRVGRESGSSCVDVFAKWLVAVQDENVESGNRRDVELMVEDDDDEGKVVGRRHVFDEIEIKDYDEERGRVSICVPPKNALLLMRCRSDPVKMEALAHRFWEPQLPAEDEEEEEVACYDKEEKAEVNLEKVEVEKELEVFEERRASVSGNINEEVEENKVEQVEGNEVEQEEDMLEVEVQVNEVISEDLNVSEEVQDIEEEKTLEEDLHVSEEEVQDIEEDKTLEEDMHVSEEVQYSEEEKAVEDLQMNEEAQVGEQEERNKILVEEENESSFVTAALEVFVNQESVEVAEEKSRVSLDNKPNQTYSVYSALVTEYEEVSSEDEISKPEQREQEKEAALEFDANESTDEAEAEAEKETQEEDQTQSSEAQLQVGEEQEESIDTDNTKEEEEVKNNALVLERESNLEIIKKEERETQKTTPMLPNCLLLMMCEPKLSMEVSKETWVCSTDFIRWQRPQKKKPHAPPCQYNKSGPGNEEQVTEKRNSVDFKCDNPFAVLPPPYPAAQNQPALQPARASCCLPAAKGGVSMATMIEQKLVDAVAYEPFVLTRCKSEPMRTASKLATQEAACFWKNRAMEPHRRATFGVGAAGVGC